VAWRSYSGLNARQRATVRRLGMKAANLGLQRKATLHYTQSWPARWEGVSKKLKAWKGQCPTHADCSSFVTWVLWNGLDHYGLKDIVNGQHWKGGYTGTLLENGREVKRGWARKLLDIIIYGQPGTTGEHTAAYVGGGMVISNGSEAGPFYLRVDYRPDRMATRRYI
jgi:cell wall-associated NlpC family hydrolase